MPQPRSIPALVRDAALEAGDRCFLKWIDPSEHAPQDAAPVSITFGDFAVMVRQMARVFEEAGLKAGDRVLLLADNSPAWQAAAIAAQTLKAEPAALFASLGQADILDITCRVQPKIVYVGNAAQWTKLRDILKSIGGHPALVVAAEKALPPDPEFSWKGAGEVFTSEPMPEDVFHQKVDALSGEDPFVLIFTSGTTGRQKGVRLAQHAAMAALDAGIAATRLVERDLGLHILPFAHIAGLCAFYVALKVRSPTILCSRREDLIRGFTFGPTYTLLVPLIYERIRKEVLKGIAAKPKPISRLLLRGMEANLTITKGKNAGLADRLAFFFFKRLVGAAVKKKFGGRIRLLGAGGAHSEPELVAFYRGLGFDYLNFYGMSETCGIISLTRIGDPHINIGSVGKPWDRVDVKINVDGEILVRGATLMTGYLEPEGNVDAFTKDGFFRTGDLGSLDEDGNLLITGRKKNIFVLTTGKKVSPEPVELRLRQTLPVSDAVLVGDGKAFVAAGLFIPHEELEHLQKNSSLHEISSTFLKQIKTSLKEFSEYEIPKQVFIIEGAPYDYPKIVTPTFKIKRNLFARTFSSQIDKIYDGHHAH